MKSNIHCFVITLVTLFSCTGIFCLRENAIKADAVQKAIQALNEKHAESRTKALDQLEELGPLAKAAIPVLIDTLTDSDKEIRRKARNALASMGECAVESLVRALSHKNSDVRYEAGFALELIGPKAKAAIPTLIRTFQFDEYSSVRVISAWALGKINDPKVIPLLIHAMKTDEDVMVRRASASALGLFRSEVKTVVPVLLDAMQDKKVFAGISGRALTFMDERAVPLLIDVIKNPKDKRRLDALWVIKGMRERAKSAIPELIVALNDEQESVRIASAQAFYYMGCEAKYAIPALTKALIDRSKFVRIEAAQSIIGIMTEEESMDELELQKNFRLIILPVLIDGLNDHNSKVRSLAAHVISTIGYCSSKAVPVLVECLKDPEEDVRRNVIWALRSIEPAAKEAIPALEKYINTEKNSILRDQAKKALNSIREHSKNNKE